MPGLAHGRGAGQLTSLLSAALIVRDEEQRLEACLASVAGVVDDIVVVDTGSLDATVDIAHAFGAQVFHHAWQQDFSAARNVALDHVASRWVLSLDADERLRPVHRDEVVALLDGTTELALRVLLFPFAHSTPYLEYRLWRNDPRIRFRGVVNERIIDAVGEVAAGVGGTLGDCRLALDHEGYHGDQTAKLQRNLTLLRRQLAVEGDNVFNWRQLARALRALGRVDEVDAALGRAVAMSQAHPGATEDSLAWVDLVECRRDRGDDVTALVAEGRTYWPENWQLLWIEGQSHLAHGRYPEAESSFHRLLDVDVAALPVAGIAYDERIFGVLAHASRGLCLFRMGRYPEAAVAYRAAELLEPDSLEYRAKRVLCQRRATTPDSAAEG